MLAALTAFVIYGTAVATPLVTSEALAPAPRRGPLLYAYPRPPATPGKAVQATGSGWAFPVAAAVARYAFEARTSYHALPESALPPRPALELPVVAAPPELPIVSSYPGITVVDDPNSRFRLAVDRERHVVTVTVDEIPGLTFEIDYRDRRADAHRIGITPVLDGHRLEGEFHRTAGELTFPLVTPTFDAGRVTYTNLTNVNDAVWVRFEGGPYTNLRRRPEAEGDTYLEAAITLDEDKIRIDLEGLYYVRPAVGSEMLFTHDEKESTSLAVLPGQNAFLTNIDSPTRVKITDPTHGSYWLRTDVTRLQVQWDGVGTAFELDFDHAFKDYGQASVQSRLVFATPLAEDS